MPSIRFVRQSKFTILDGSGFEQPGKEEAHRKGAKDAKGRREHILKIQMLDEQPRQGTGG
jgi:hypothetical protein